VPNPSIVVLTAAIHNAKSRCGTTRVVLIDGPAGSGKTTIANRLAIALGGRASGGAGTFDPAEPLPADAPVQILHGDDMYEGWSGLATLDTILLDQVLEPLARGDAAGFRMWDWVADRRSHLISVPARPYVIIEGVGVALPRARKLAALTIWVEAPWEVRLARGQARDGNDYDVTEKWRTFDAEEQALHERSGTRAAADFRVDGTQPVPDRPAQDSS
jgi:uridine kinase